MSSRKPTRLKKGKPSAAKDRKTPSPSTRFEIKIRADKKLNVTTRLLWLLVAMSHSKGHTYMTEAEMAKQLGTSIRQVQMSLKVIEEAGYFRQVKPPGIHRPRQWHRVCLPGEEPNEFVCRIQSDGRFDLCVLLHWIASDMTAKTGAAQFPTPREWEVSSEALKGAAQDAGAGSLRGRRRPEQRQARNLPQENHDRRRGKGADQEAGLQPGAGRVAATEETRPRTRGGTGVIGSTNGWIR